MINNKLLMHIIKYDGEYIVDKHMYFNKEKNMVILISTKYYLGVEVFILGLFGVNSDLTGELTVLT